MAKPIYSFFHKPTKKRYYQIWDTVIGYPLTVPMELLTFIQYWDANDKEKIGILYERFDCLNKNGTSLFAGEFNDLPPLFQKQAYDYIDLNVDAPNEIEDNINKQFELLFSQDLDFFDFYKSYLELISGISIYPKRQQNYYLSWAHTMRFEVNNGQTKEIIDDIYQQYSLPLSKSGDPMYRMDEWFKQDLFNTYPDGMAKLFYLFGKNNLIGLDAIPHVLRISEEIQSLFYDFGMENMLPNKSIKYKIDETSSFQYKEFNEIKFLRQFANLLSFSYYNGEPLIGVPISTMEVEELQELLRDSVSVFSMNLINFMDKYGNLRLPMMYTNYFGYDTNDKFLVLSPFDRQRYHVYNQNGKLIDDGEYYDFKFMDENIGYFQHTDDLSWIRWIYNSNDNVVNKKPVLIDNYFSDVDWQEIENSYNTEINSNLDKLQETNFNIIDLVFGKKNDRISLSVFTYIGMTEQSIKAGLKGRLKRIITKNKDRNNIFQIGIELYKEIIYEDLISDYYPAILNVFEFCYNPESSYFEFKENYCNDVINDFLPKENYKIRSVFSLHSLRIVEDFGHYSSEIIAYFKINKSRQVFKIDCEKYIESQPKTVSESLLDYSKRFISCLTALGYEEEPSYDYCIDNELTDSKLIAEIENSKTNYSSNIELENEGNDLPF